MRGGGRERGSRRGARGRTGLVAAVVLGGLLAAGPALADMVLPLFFGPALFQVVALVPVIILEYVVVRRSLPDIGEGIGTAVILANLATFVLGFVVAVLLDGLFTEPIGRLPEGAPFHDILTAYTVFPEPDFWSEEIATAILFLLYFAMSWVVEGVILRLVVAIRWKRAFAASLRANAWSYGALYALLLAIVVAGRIAVAVSGLPDAGM